MITTWALILLMTVKGQPTETIIGYSPNEKMCIAEQDKAFQELSEILRNPFELECRMKIVRRN